MLTVKFIKSKFMGHADLCKRELLKIASQDASKKITETKEQRIWQYEKQYHCL